MFKQKKIKFILAGAFVLASALTMTSALADDYNPSWYISPSLHAAQIDDGFGSGSNAYGVGLRFGKPISDDFDLQIGSTYTRSKNSDQRFYQNTYSLDALYFFSRQVVRPFIVFGIGAERDRMNSAFGQADRYSPNANIGAGIQYVLSDQLSLQVDLRKVHGYLRGNDFGFSQASNGLLSIALTYAFDKTPSRPQAQARAPELVQAVIATPPIVVIPAAPPPPARFEKVTLSATELFGFDSATLGSDQPKLDGIAEALTTNTQINNVVITGYADRIGTKKYNQKLSEERANAVKTYLSNKGISGNRMSASGKGESNPVVECHDRTKAKLIECLEPNRRVEIDQITIEQRVR